MKPVFGGWVAGAALLALSMSHPPCFAQAKAQVTERIHLVPPGGPPPRAADGHPDFSGVWFPNGGGRDLEAFEGSFAGDVLDPGVRGQFDPVVTPEEKPSFQPWAEAKIKAMSPAELELGRASVNCIPRGVPGIAIINPYPIQFVQTSGMLVELIEILNNFRVIHTDGRPHSKTPDPTFNGDATAHWEKDTLVIDTIAIDERTWNDFVGWFHSDQEHVIERISRPSMNYLIYQVIVEDPKVLTKPWVSAPRRWTLGHEDLQEYYCTNNEEINELKIVSEKEKHKQQGK